MVYSLLIAFFVRGYKGYTLSDVYNMDSYLSKIILRMLRDFKRENDGCPTNMTEEDWVIIIDEIIEGLVAYRQNLSYPEDSNPALYEDRRRKFNRGMALFSAYFGNFWI